MIILSNKLTN